MIISDKIKRGLCSGMSISYWSLIRQVGLQWLSNRAHMTPIGLESGMWAFDEACWSPIKHAEVSDGCKSGMSVYDRSSKGLL